VNDGQCHHLQVESGTGSYCKQSEHLCPQLLFIMASLASSSKNEKKATKRPIPSMKESNFEVGAMMLPSLYRLTEGLPRKELKTMVSEAIVCEEALEDEIRLLQDALENPDIANENPEVQTMIDIEVTPADRFFTVSALLGRLRDELTTPLPPNSIIPLHRAQASLFPLKKKQKKEETADASNPVPVPAVDHMSTLDKQKQVLALYTNPEYSKEHRESTMLLSLWKKISSHRSSLVFRRPVNPKEAPGYTERINFPMDLSLIRKMIVARQIKSYRDLHQRLGLIAHNCVKYNGR
jgi:Bromodomain